MRTLEHHVAPLAVSGPCAGPAERPRIERDIQEKAGAIAADAKVLTIEHRGGVRGARPIRRVPTPRFVTVLPMVDAYADGLIRDHWLFCSPSAVSSDVQKEAIDSGRVHELPGASQHFGIGNRSLSLRNRGQDPTR
jgi:hypothetical protein